MIRASKVHGIGTAQAREWVFVKRILDERKTVFLAREGRDINHTTAAANTAALIEQVARIPGRRILNSADPDAPSALEICRTVAQHFGSQWQEILLADDVDPELGAHPWTAVHPVVLETSASLALGYRPVGNYAETIGAELDWLIANPAERPDDDDPFFTGLFDYASENRHLV
ncbi:nucleoside-diphosphate-sugar epimerase [Renibacterium salmoninarum ATCC 33209]|uniref:Nucleoside-diphosphate-sugar epimerase n=1 Tax=Renibacterium salmoninarum (strain ATCC 33209 / DSM 20767 / JCM 11484 / NBRC 15589 / NCIMB 2235) TaxID=288705 RepID=A9WRV7_RENSM|nr:hypothetical protein [Renibacterium salmoninarum]ABY24389.1 nucleoside-diphosphate-sugar epimerase [Renibacterium salmoninarum ATCC 33209]